MKSSILDERQYDKIADILINLGTICFGATVIPFLVGVDKFAPVQVLLGIILSVSIWIIAVILVDQ